MLMLMKKLLGLLAVLMLADEMLVRGFVMGGVMIVHTHSHGLALGLWYCNLTRDLGTGWSYADLSRSRGVGTPGQIERRHFFFSSAVSCSSRSPQWGRVGWVDWVLS
jgi:hypothetical protein